MDIVPQVIKYLGSLVARNNSSPDRVLLTNLIRNRSRSDAVNHGQISYITDAGQSILPQPSFH